MRDFVNAHPRTITQGHIAAKLGIAPTTLSGLLAGKLIPSRKQALRLGKRCLLMNHFGVARLNVLLRELAAPGPLAQTALR